MFPKTIKILGHNYSIIEQENYIAESCGNTGRCNNYSNIITVGKELPQSSKNEVLIHEILEALNYRLELNLDHYKIAILGETLHQVFADNGLYFGQNQGSKGL